MFCKNKNKRREEKKLFALIMKIWPEPELVNTCKLVFRPASGKISLATGVGMQVCTAHTYLAHRGPHFAHFTSSCFSSVAELTSRLQPVSDWTSSSSTEAATRRLSSRYKRGEQLPRATFHTPVRSETQLYITTDHIWLIQSRATSSGCDAVLH